MACIIKLPDDKKGIISFTHAENNYFDDEIRNFLIENRKDWLYLLHHNWQPCSHDNFFDASLCNLVDLYGPGPCLDIDCCNFSPNVFSPSNNEKIFDVLYVARAASFKRIMTFYNVCKELLEKKPDIKILFICSVPELDCDPIDPKGIYLSMFTREERSNFLALFFDYDYPFTVSKDFLGHFYKSSKLFLHTANNERHPRVCSYAWSSGIPVVGYRNLALFLPNRFQSEPYFYEVQSDNEYCSSILKALEKYSEVDYKMPYDDIKYYVNQDFSKNLLIDKLNSMFNIGVDESDLFLNNLDFRMGRHCIISFGDNSLPISIIELIKQSSKITKDLVNHSDIEKFLSTKK